MLTEGEGYKEVQLGPKKDEVPINWKVLKLKNVAKIISGSTPSKGKKEFWNGDIVFITPTDITENDSKYISNSKEKITDEGLNSCSIHLLEPGAVLMTSRATIGEASINKIPVCTNQGFKSIVTGEELHNEYFYYYIPLIKGYLNAIGGGSTFSEINKGDTESIKIPLPPISEQNKIAEVLSTVDEAIQKTEEIIERIKELKKGLMQDLLTKGIGHEEFKEVHLGPKTITAPKAWTIKRVKDVCENLDNERIPIKESNRTNGNIPYYGATGCIDYVGDYIFDEELVLIGEDGADWSDFANTSYIIKGKSWVNNHVHVLRARDVKENFFSEFINMLDLNHVIVGTNRGKLNKKHLMNLEILHPPLPEQEKIAKVLSTVDEKIQKEKEYKEKLEKLKKGLMQDLLTGKVRVLPLLSEEEKDELKESDVTG